MSSRAADRLRRYAPPVLPDVSAPQTAYTYAPDGQLAGAARPDGITLAPAYDPASGRLQTLPSGEGDYRYGYLPGGRAEFIQAPGDLHLAYGWDGPLLRRVSWSGAVAGQVEYTCDANFWLSQLKVGKWMASDGRYALPAEMG